MATATAGETTRNPTITDDLRTFIRDSGLRGYRLARRSGVSEATISRFMRGERDVVGSTIDALCSTLGLALVQFPVLVEPPVDQVELPKLANTPTTDDGAPAESWLAWTGRGLATRPGRGRRTRARGLMDRGYRSLHRLAGDDPDDQAEDRRDT